MKNFDKTIIFVLGYQEYYLNPSSSGFIREKFEGTIHKFKFYLERVRKVYGKRSTIFYPLNQSVVGNPDIHSGIEGGNFLTNNNIDDVVYGGEFIYDYEDGNIFSSPITNHIIQSIKPDHVYVMGCPTNSLVFNASMGLSKMGLNTFVLQDATFDKKQVNVSEVVGNLRDNYRVRISSVEKILE